MATQKNGQGVQGICTIEQRAELLLATSPAPLRNTCKRGSKLLSNYSEVHEPELYMGKASGAHLAFVA